MAERVLIAGCGDLGRRVAARLLARGDRVLGLRRRPPAADASGIEWIAGDLAQPSTLRGLPGDVGQVVFAPTPDARDEAAYRAVFVDGLAHLLAVLDPARVRRVLFVSSSAVYGDHGEAWVDEDTPPAPPGFNGRVLLEAEHLLTTRSIPGVVLRLAGLYGPGRMQLIERLRAGEVRVPRPRPHWSNRIHVDDAAAAIAHLLRVRAPQPLYLGVDDTPLPLDLLYDHLASLAGAPRPADGPPPFGIGSKRLRNARLAGTGWLPRWPDAREGYAALLGQEQGGDAR